MSRHSTCTANVVMEERRLLSEFSVRENYTPVVVSELTNTMAFEISENLFRRFERRDRGRRQSKSCLKERERDRDKERERERETD